MVVAAVAVTTPCVRCCYHLVENKGSHDPRRGTRRGMNWVLRIILMDHPSFGMRHVDKCRACLVGCRSNVIHAVLRQGLGNFRRRRNGNHKGESKHREDKRLKVYHGEHRSFEYSNQSIVIFFRICERLLALAIRKTMRFTKTIRTSDRHTSIHPQTPTGNEDLLFFVRKDINTARISCYWYFILKYILNLEI